MRVTPNIVEEFKRYRAKHPSPRLSSLYGTDKIIKEYLQLPQLFPLAYACYLEHGIAMQYDKLPAKAFSNGPEIFLLDNSMRTKLIPPNKHAFTLGPPFVHYRQGNSIKQKEGCEGTIAFPVHTTAEFPLEVQWNNYAEKLLKLPDSFHPVEVCMYWMDIVEGRHKIFEDLGFNVVTNGHMGTKDFAWNFYKNTTNKKFATSNDVTSALYYAVEMDIPFFIYGKEDDMLYGNDSYTKQIDSHPFVVKIRKAFSKKISELDNEVVIDQEQKSLVNFIIDEENWDSPEIIRKFLIRNLPKIMYTKGYHHYFKN